MLTRIVSGIRGAVGGALRAGCPLLLCAAALGIAGLLQLCGAVDSLSSWQRSLLAGHPFYLSADEAHTTLLSPAATWAACAALTLYLSAVLLREPRLGRRSYLCLLAAVATQLPGCMCVLWHGVLYTALPLLCIALLWLATVPAALLARHHTP